MFEDYLNSLESELLQQKVDQEAQLRKIGDAYMKTQSELAKIEDERRPKRPPKDRK